VKKQTIPSVPMMMKPVDGGSAVIGVIECPWCGQTHFTTQIQCGERTVFCGTRKGKAQRPDGHSKIIITQIL
jgi:hypothetical protein